MDSDALIKLCHEQAHVAAHDPEDTVFFALTRRDTWIFALSLLVLGQGLTCLDDEIGDLLTRFAEVTEVQKWDEWRAE